MSASKFTNFLAQYKDKETKKLRNFTASQFAEVWSHYDADGNGYIEGSELDSFLREFIVSILGEDINPDELNKETLSDLKRDFLDAFDQNSDNKIEMSELAQVLPTDEVFLLLFRKNAPLDSSVEFMKIWKQFDKDQSGFIEADELKNFLSEFLKEARPEEQISEEKLIEYTSTMLHSRRNRSVDVVFLTNCQDSLLQLFDSNKDGKLQLSEMARLLPVKENYLCRPIFKNADKITTVDIENVFHLYDRAFLEDITRFDAVAEDKNGTIENEELQGFLKDLLALVQEDYDKDDLEFFRQIILNEWDVNHDGKISMNELKMMLMQQSRLAKLTNLNSRQ